VYALKTVSVRIVNPSNVPHNVTTKVSVPKMHSTTNTCVPAVRNGMEIHATSEDV